VNDATSTPDDPDGTAHDGKGAVATGEQAAVTPADGAGNGQRAEDTPPAPPRPSPGPPVTPPAAARPVVEDEPDVPATAPVEPPTANGGPPDKRTAASAAVAAEAPTAEMRMPTNGSRPAPAVSGDDDVTRPVGPGKLPAAGPVPGPGPAAAAPPPWQRVPGREAQIPAQAAPPPAGGLLDDEGPTAFLEAPAREDDTGPTAETSSSWGSVRAVRNRPPRQAALQLKRLDPWSVLKLALVLAVVLFFVWLVAVGVLYGVLNGMGVWDRLNGTYADLVSGAAPTGSPLISAGRVFGLAAVVGAINSLLFAVTMTVGAFVYNVSADLVGGIEVTLSERD
jgi:hypothetical protein